MNSLTAADPQLHIWLLHIRNIKYGELPVPREGYGKLYLYGYTSIQCYLVFLLSLESHLVNSSQSTPKLYLSRKDEAAARRHTAVVTKQ